MNPKDLIAKLKALEGLSHDEKSALIDLLNTKKKYGIVWEEKPEAVEAQLRTELPVLVEVPERRIETKDDRKKIKEATGKMPGDTRKSTASFVIPEGELYSAQEAAQGGEAARIPFREDKNPEGEGTAPNHILIEGDNLHALTALSFTHEGRVDVIYIDPPYNTGNKDFKYNDSFVDREDSYRHSKWMSFMHKRLLLARRLLKDTGVIFISIDDNEQAQLKLLCDEVFGEENFKNILAVRRRSKSLNLQFADAGLSTLNVGFEYILVYSKQPEKTFNPIKKEKVNAAVKGTWNVFWSNADRPTMRYDILGFTPRSGQWRWSEELAKKSVANYLEYLNHFANDMSLEEYWEKTGEQLKFVRRIEGGTGKNGGVQYWVPPSQTSLRTTNWTDIEVSEIHKEIDLNFNNPKSKALIIEALKLSNFPIKKIPDTLILDFFAGSGTTLHATMQLNAEDGGTRQCILVTNNENNICEEVTYERNKRVIQGYTNSKGVAVPGLGGNNLRYYRTAFVPAAKTEANKRALTAAATDLLCIKEDCYTEITQAEGFNPAQCRLFTNEAGRVLAVVYYSRRFPETVAQLTAWIGLPPAPSEGGGEGREKIRLYAFSPEKETLLEDFAPVADRVEAIPLPEAIYNAYRATFRTLKLEKKKVEAVAEDVVMQNELAV